MSDPHSAPDKRLRQVLDHLKSRKTSHKLSGKVCVLTGVGNKQGIGWATAILFAQEDAKHLYLLDLKDHNFSDLINSVKAHNPNIGVATFVGNAADEELIKSICQRAIDDHGHLDVFFANAGVATYASLTDTTLETVRTSVNVNTLSCWLALKYASSAMLKNTFNNRGGSIIFTSSVAGVRAGAGSVDYSASKAAVRSLAYTGANAYPGSGIRVNAICPGLIQTPMTAAMFQSAKDKSKIGQLCSLRRYGIADEVAQVVLFLAGNDSSYVNGVDIPVDGGLSSSLPVVPGKFF
ncbi:hypothetical protein O181_052775 [Austropuccinia psidii MF-1]|uniref:NAD(P)-binding protein n=1 Tax=Austropuccinia psidii MF-1 TaxID=1389203 RepID=A0A9Q3DZG1_9BASI|nr:hypothetical protein [Austropuccinia psidii MF-1]